MINLILTNKCNRQCPYCFALDMQVTSGNRYTFMTELLFNRCIDLICASNGNEVRLLGGEPTLHPSFNEFVERALASEIKVLVFSNGLMPSNVRDFLCSLPLADVRVLVNTNPPENYSSREWAILKETMGCLGRRVTCGFNISDIDFNAEYCLTLIEELDLYPALRLGLAHPTISGKNRYLTWGKAPIIAAQIIKLAEMADSKDIIIGFDCGFTLCMFKDWFKELILFRVNTGFKCRPILDVTPDGQVWHCLSLWGHHGLNLEDYKTEVEIRQSFDRFYQRVRQFGIMETCKECKYIRTAHCTGGCLSRNLRQWK